MSRYVRRTAGSVHWRTSEDFLQDIEKGPFRDVDALFARARVLKDLRSKRLMEFEEGENTFLIKLYREPGFGALLRRLFVGSKALLELRRSLAVLRRGIPTVPVSAVGERPGESFLVVEKLLDWRSLQDALLSPDVGNDEKRRLLFEYGAFSRQVHDAGIDQDDFNPTNILVKTWGKAIELKLVDFERARVHGSLSEPRRLRLVAKLCRERSVGRARLLIFLDGYLSKYPEDQRREKEIVGVVHRFADELSRRDSAKREQRCVEENRNFGRFETKSHFGFYRKVREDTGGKGISVEEAKTLAGDGADRYVFRRHEEAVHQWKQANARVLKGGPLPYAVVCEKGGQRGVIAYLREEILERGLDWTSDAAP